MYGFLKECVDLPQLLAVERVVLEKLESQTADVVLDFQQLAFGTQREIVSAFVFTCETTPVHIFERAMYHSGGRHRFSSIATRSWFLRGYPKPEVVSA